MGKYYQGRLIICDKNGRKKISIMYNNANEYKELDYTRDNRMSDVTRRIVTNYAPDINIGDRVLRQNHGGRINMGIYNVENMRGAYEIIKIMHKIAENETYITMRILLGNERKENERGYGKL